MRMSPKLQSFGIQTLSSEVFRIRWTPKRALKPSSSTTSSSIWPRPKRASPPFHGILPADGLLLLNCPNRHGAFFTLATLLDRVGLQTPFERMWQVGLPSPHLWYYAPRDLEILAERTGFRRAKKLRMDTLDYKGLWNRISYAKSQNLFISLGAFIGAVILIPFLRLLPADSIALIFVQTAPEEAARLVRARDVSAPNPVAANPTAPPSSAG